MEDTKANEMIFRRMLLMRTLRKYRIFNTIRYEK